MPDSPFLYAFVPGSTDITKTPAVVLGCRGVTVLFLYGTPWAVCDGVEVSFPDLPGKQGLSPTVRRRINAFHPELPQTRVDFEDFQYLVVAGLMRSLRPLLRSPSRKESHE